MASKKPKKTRVSSAKQSIKPFDYKMTMGKPTTYTDYSKNEPKSAAYLGYQTIGEYRKP